MSALREAAQQALEALEDWDSPVALPAITALRAALAQQQEPVAEVVSRTERVGFGRVEDRKDVLFLADLPVGTMLYTHPPRRETEQEPVAFADQISFDQAMKSGKGHDVWPKAGDYEARTGRKLRALFTHPPRMEWQSLPACEDKPHAVLVEGYGYVDVRAVRAVEAALKERGVRPVGGETR